MIFTLLSEKYTDFYGLVRKAGKGIFAGLILVSCCVHSSELSTHYGVTPVAQSPTNTGPFDTKYRNYQIKKSDPGENEYQEAERYRHQKDFKRAERFYLIAAKRGNVNAHFRLGQMYATGRGSVRSVVEAHMHYNMSSYLGSEEARAAMFALEGQMTEDQLERAMQRAVLYRKLNNL